jgi:hypothetical protein
LGPTRAIVAQNEKEVLKDPLKNAEIFDVQRSTRMRIGSEPSLWCSKRTWERS